MQRNPGVVKELNQAEAAKYSSQDPRTMGVKAWKYRHKLSHS